MSTPEPATATTAPPASSAPLGPQSHNGTHHTPTAGLDDNPTAAVLTSQSENDEAGLTDLVADQTDRESISQSLSDQSNFSTGLSVSGIAVEHQHRTLTNSMSRSMTIRTPPWATSPSHHHRGPRNRSGKASTSSSKSMAGHSTATSRASTGCPTMSRSKNALTSNMSSSPCD